MTFIIQHVSFHQVRSLLNDQEQHGIESLPNTSTHAWHLTWEFYPRPFDLESNALSTRPHAPKHIIILQIIRIVYAGILCNEISVTVNYLAHLAGIPIIVSDISGTDHSVHDPSPGESSLAAGVGDDRNIGGTELIGNRA